MFGQTHVICRLSDLPRLKLMSREDVEVVLDEATAGDPESVDLLAYWMDTAMKRPIERMMEYIGENPDVSGGTMGAPNQVSHIVFVMREVLLHKLKAGFFAHLDPSGPMWNDPEIARRSLQDFFWKLVEYGI